MNVIESAVPGISRPGGNPLARSLKLRVTLLTLAILCVLSLWALAWTAISILKTDMEGHVADQLSSGATQVSTKIDEGLRERLKWIGQVAGRMDARMMADPKAVQKFLDERIVAMQLFNAGLFVTDADGVAIADVSRTGGRLGVSYRDREPIAASASTAVSRKMPPMPIAA